MAEKLIDGNVNPDLRKYLRLLYASAATLLSVKGYTDEAVGDAVYGYKDNTLNRYLKS